jgi:hypothetical protein
MEFLNNQCHQKTWTMKQMIHETNQMRQLIYLQPNEQAIIECIPISCHSNCHSLTWTWGKRRSKTQINYLTASNNLLNNSRWFTLNNVDNTSNHTFWHNQWCTVFTSIVHTTKTWFQSMTRKKNQFSINKNRNYSSHQRILV